MKHGWKYRKIAEVTSLVTDGDWIESKDQSESGIRLIQTGNIGVGIFKAKDDKPHYISEETFSRLGCTEIFEGDCLVSRLPDPIGRACILPSSINRMITAVDCTIIRFANTIFPPFFVYYSRSKQYQLSIDNQTTGSTRKRISRKNLEKVEIPVPSIEEQEAICSLLDNLNLVIEKKKQQIEELDNLTQSLFFDMFGDPVANDKGWSIDRLEANCEVSSTKRVLVEDVVESGIPFLRGTELTALSKSVSSKNVTFTMFITPEHYERVKAVTGVPKKGDILIPSINSEGITWVVDTDEPFYFKDGRVIWVHVNTNVFVSQYLSSAITRILKANYFLLTSGATFLELKLFIIRDLLVPIPPLPLQQAFAEKVKAIEQQKELINQSIKDVQTLFDAKMDYYFGE